ncbi:tellurite resistance TerB family protein [Phormidium nigroviride]
MSYQSQKNAKSSDFFRTANSKASGIELTAPEALMAISILAVSADGKMAQEEKQTLGANHVRLFSAYSREEFQELFKKVLGLVNKYRPSDVFIAAKNGLTPKLRQTAFAIAADLVLADGVFTQEEQDLLVELWEALELKDEIGQKIMEVMIIKNCTDNS